MKKTKLCVLMLLLCLSAEALDTPPVTKDPVVLPLSKAKTPPSLKRFVSASVDGSFVVRWMDAKDAIDYDLDVEPGRYRLTVTFIPDGGGYLLAKVDDGPAVRRPLAKLKGPWKPQELKMGELEVPVRHARLRFTPDNAVAPGLCSFIQAELTWAGPLALKSQVKSPTETAADKAKAAKVLEEAKAAAQLVAKLKGTSWNWYATQDFTGEPYPMSFETADTMSLPWNRATSFKAVDGKTIDVYYNEKAFWRLRFSDDLRSFKADQSEGMRQPKSGKMK